MKETKCKGCNNHLGHIVLGDIYCSKCKSINVIRPQKDTKLVFKDFYKPSTDLKYCTPTTYTMAIDQTRT